MELSADPVKGHRDSRTSNKQENKKPSPKEQSKKQTN
jgi:hypothetical protein